MLPHLSPLRESVWVRITLLSFSCGVLAVTAWILGGYFLPVPSVYLGLSIGALILATSVLIGKIVANYSLASTDFLARAILLVSHPDSYKEAPLESRLGPAKDFLSDLAKSVYRLTSAEVAATSEAPGELGFYRSMASTLPLPIFVLDKDRNITFANEAGYRYINKSAEDVIGKPFYDSLNLMFVSNMTLESWLDTCSQGTVTEQEVWERVRLNLSDEVRKQFDLAAHYSNDDPNGLETTLVLFDRTRQYERDDHDLTFVALAVHELRTPLTIMRGYIEVFEDEISENLTPEQTTFMHNMGASAQQLTAFVSNILNVARVEENALMLRLKEEQWPEVLMSACRDMELRAAVRNKKLVYDIAENLPTVAVDKVSVYEVLANLIDNAIKYTHTDEEITIRTYEKDGMIETTVTDKGVGIPENFMSHVFDKFYRSHHSKNSVGGTGLGLFLSRAIVAAHGGTIWVKSKEGEGSTFGFTLPIYASVADQISSDDNGAIVRGAHGWIKNHSLYRE